MWEAKAAAGESREEYHEKRGARERKVPIREDTQGERVRPELGQRLEYDSSCTTSRNLVEMLLGTAVVRDAGERAAVMSELMSELLLELLCDERCCCVLSVSCCGESCYAVSCCGERCWGELPL